MRVKIGYTVELEEIENEVREIMHKALLHLEHALEEATTATGSLDTGDAKIRDIIHSLEITRIKLSKTDMIISDCQDILKGYVQILEKSMEEEQDEET